MTSIRVRKPAKPKPKKKPPPPVDEAKPKRTGKGQDKRGTARAMKLHPTTGVGRPSKFNDHTRATVINHLMIGGYVDDAAALAGVTEQTVYEWISRGRAEEERRAAFAKEWCWDEGRAAFPQSADQRAVAEDEHDAFCKQNEPYFAFFHDVARAQSTGTAAMLASITKVASGGVVESTTVTTRQLPDGTLETTTVERRTPPNWQAAAWRLERRLPKKFGRHERVEMTGADGGAVEVEYVDKLEAALNKLAPKEEEEEEPEPEAPVVDAAGN